MSQNMQHRICLIGSMSVGKTTLFNLLKAEKSLSDFVFIEESARAIIDEINFHPTLMTLEQRQKFQTQVRNRQLQNEKSAGSNSFISDRSVIDGLSYMSDFPDIAWHKSEINSYLSQSPYTHIFYLPIEFSFDDKDRSKEDGDFQVFVDKFLRSCLEEMQANYTELQGSSPERKEQILKILGR
jgi:predicted ATPase